MTVQDESMRREVEQGIEAWLDGVVKQLEKYEFSRFAFGVEDSTVTVPLVRIRRIRSRFGVREW